MAVIWVMIKQGTLIILMEESVRQVAVVDITPNKQGRGENV